MDTKGSQVLGVSKVTHEFLTMGVGSGPLTPKGQLYLYLCVFKTRESLRLYDYPTSTVSILKRRNHVCFIHYHILSA